MLFDNPYEEVGKRMKPARTMLSAILVTVSLNIFSTANLSGQGIGVAARGGTMGVGAEVSLGFYQKFAIRGGFG